MRFGVLLGVLLGVAFVPTTVGAERKHGFLKRVHVEPDGRRVKYEVFVPYAYGGDKPFPLILFLHGAAEGGVDGHRPVEVGIGPAIRKDPHKFPFFVVFPQAQGDSWQAGTKDARRALDILDGVAREFKVDAKRLYLTGIATGGSGSWSLAARYPDRWAALVPVCGAGDPAQAYKIKSLPCWCFHGEADRTVSPTKSRHMIDAIKAAGGKPRYTELPGTGHNCWDKAYGLAELYAWLEKQHR